MLDGACINPEYSASVSTNVAKTSAKSMAEYTVISMVYQQLEYLYTECHFNIKVERVNVNLKSDVNYVTFTFF